MKIYVAENCGFCKGVEHAVNTALSLKSENAYILGEIIHNDEVIRAIKDRGLKVVETLDEIPDNCTVVFRSHGVPKSYYNECANRNIKVVDCTCGFVKRTQNIVAEQSQLGNFIVIAGEPTHPEVVGLLGWCGSNAVVINDENKIPDILADKNICIVSQTTFSALKFEKIIKNIKKLCEKTVAVFKTICYTTIERQSETEKLAQMCEAMLVVGGLNSSNTNKLYEIALKYCGNVFRLANSEDMDYSKLKKFKSVGIVSGASTPNAQTREVLLKMEE
ncbi:MAG: 4-hydroxy-3-methylbut-2-enyl diphosphate reductase, partial [Clostridia bacterium]|nr:4-hydroxy-3-methylbut-2-enyl diphosphate reductase [Clostridia bacterium]